MKASQLEKNNQIINGFYFSLSLWRVPLGGCVGALLQKKTMYFLKMNASICCTFKRLDLRRVPEGKRYNANPSTSGDCVG